MPQPTTSDIITIKNTSNSGLYIPCPNHKTLLNPYQVKEQRLLYQYHYKSRFQNLQNSTPQSFDFHHSRSPKIKRKQVSPKQSPKILGTTSPEAFYIRKNLVKLSWEMSSQPYLLKKEAVKEKDFQHENAGFIMRNMKPPVLMQKAPHLKHKKQQVKTGLFEDYYKKINSQSQTRYSKERLSFSNQ